MAVLIIKRGYAVHSGLLKKKKIQEKRSREKRGIKHEGHHVKLQRMDVRENLAIYTRTTV